MRKLVLLITMIVFSFANFSFAKAQMSNFLDTNIGFGTLRMPESKEDWEEICGTSWECNWAWEDPLVMAQMIMSSARNGQAWSSSFTFTEGDLWVSCVDFSVGANGNVSNCSAGYTGGVEGALTADDIRSILGWLLERFEYSGVVAGRVSYRDNSIVGGYGPSACPVESNEVTLTCVLVP